MSIVEASLYIEINLAKTFQTELGVFISTLLIMTLNPVDSIQPCYHFKEVLPKNKFFLNNLKNENSGPNYEHSCLN